MEVVGSGVILGRPQRPGQRALRVGHVGLCLSDGTVLATCRLGHGPGGRRRAHRGLRLDRRGETWELRYLGLAEREWDGWPGETRGWYVAELTPGVLTASVLWTDRSDPSRPVGPPGHPGPARDARLPAVSTDGGRSLARTPADRPRRRTRARRSTGPVLALADGDPGPAVRELEGVRADPDAGHRRRPGCGCRATTARPGPRTSSSPATRQRHLLLGPAARDASRRRPPRQHVLDPRRRRRPRTSTSTSRGGRPTVGRGPMPVGTGLPGQHCQPISLGGDRLLAVYSHRRRPAGDPRRAERGLRADLGPRPASSSSWASDAGDEPGAGGPRSQEEYWNDMGAWQFGHPRGALLPDRRGARRVLRRQRRNDGARAGRGSGCEPDLLLRGARVVDARGAAARNAPTSWSATGRIAAIGDGLDAAGAEVDRARRPRGSAPG